MKNSRYPAQVYWSDEDRGYIALAPDLPGCSAFGATWEKALSALQRAIDASIKAARQAGNPVPEPSRIPEPSSASGKILVRVPRMLHAELLQAAKREQTSLNQYIVSALSIATTASGLRQFIFHMSASQPHHQIQGVLNLSEGLRRVWSPIGDVITARSDDLQTLVALPAPKEAEELQDG